MGNKTRKLTLSALFSALTVVSLYLSSIWPTGQLGFAAVASLFAAGAVIEAGIASGVSVFVVSSAIGFLILPNRNALLLYVIFFGYYPIVKSLIERMRGNLISWVLKLLVFNAALYAIWFFMRGLLTVIFGGSLGGELFGMRFSEDFVFIAGGNLAFLVFDFGLTKLIWFYIQRVSKHFSR